MASHKVEIFIADVKAAFTQSKEDLRAIPMFAKVPKEGLPGLEKGTELVRLRREMYGLLAWSSGMEAHHAKSLKALGCESHPLCPCPFCFPGSKEGMWGGSWCW